MNAWYRCLAVSLISRQYQHAKETIDAVTFERAFAIRELRIYNQHMVLKPQDIVVVLKLLGYEGGRPSFAQIAKDLVMSPSEVHAAVKRAEAARLLHGPEMSNRPNVSALEEFLLHGIKYAFP